jgi:hypothetical protein
MSETAPSHYANAWDPDRDVQNEAFLQIMSDTVRPVPWAAAVWDDVVAHLADADNHNRAIAGQLLCNLAAQDSGDRILGDLPALVAVTHDPKFVTARHTLRSLWRIGLGSDVQRKAVVAALAARYQESFPEQNGTLVRSDIVDTLRHLHDATRDETIRDTALELIDTEPDEKYRAKYARFWR